MPAAKKSKKNTPQKLNNRSKRIGKLLISAGIASITIAIFIIASVFSPVVFNELAKQFRSRKPIRVDLTQSPTNKTIDVLVPKDKNAGIVIPKIRANASIVWEVDPYNEKIYQRALTKGVAHAKGSAYPGQVGNVFIFSHSSQDFLTANRYNSIFYLLTKLEKGDEIYLFYKGKPFVYSVSGHEIVKSDTVSLLTKKNNQKELTLMTCWPPGTTLQRYIVKAVEK
ncbi:class E sortase [Patescibacteria group bacterium]|nr:class E sortase [Patescibacteria group bacterium]